MKKLLLLTLVLVAAVLAPTTVYAQSIPIVPDNLVSGLLITVAISAAFAPVLGYATNSKPEENFDWRQYWRALVIVIPGTLGGALLTVSIADTSVLTSVGGQISFFIIVFLEALGVDYTKSRTAKTLSTKK